MNNKNYDNEKCPTHNKIGKFIPPPVVDKKKKKLVVTFQCPEGHDFKKEIDLK